VDSQLEWINSKQRIKY